MREAMSSYDSYVVRKFIAACKQVACGFQGRTTGNNLLKDVLALIFLLLTPCLTLTHDSGWIVEQRQSTT